MKPSLQLTKHYGCGLLVVIGMGVIPTGLIYLARRLHWGISATACGLLVVAVLFGHKRMKRERAKTLAAFHRAFAAWDGGMPAFKTESSYGFPNFTLTFASEAELKRAEETGRISAFKQSLKELYGKMGAETLHGEFDPDKAVWVTYEGWRPAFIKSPDTKS